MVRNRRQKNLKLPKIDAGASKSVSENPKFVISISPTFLKKSTRSRVPRRKHVHFSRERRGSAQHLTTGCQEPVQSKHFQRRRVLATGSGPPESAREVLVQTGKFTQGAYEKLEKFKVKIEISVIFGP